MLASARARPCPQATAKGWSRGSWIRASVSEFSGLAATGGAHGPGTGGLPLPSARGNPSVNALVRDFLGCAGCKPLIGQVADAGVHQHHLWAFRFDRRQPEHSERLKPWLAQVIANHELVISAQVWSELRSLASRKLQPLP